MEEYILTFNLIAYVAEWVVLEVFVALHSGGSEASRRLLVPLRQCMFCSERET